ncbi:ROK family protein [Arthrobacter sp. I2-34]|uniref:ROK family protein n=1 Tax=Arthrobacter hankyongi TaxID=2904801 RepID=A0ABS9L413_9MICC|nr:ROK family transcriptional regulator [Arthrobacter hankyongi]MCG2621365.1 ROK family protein [Arthrobacter hankyongi]
MDRTATTPQVLRRTNLTAVLGVMRESAALTGTDLIEATGLTRATVIAVCDDLIRRGWVRELNAPKGPGPQKGRPARYFEFNESAGCVLGLDVGMATTTVLVADLKGRILARSSERFSKNASADARRGTISRAADTALAAAGLGPSAVLAAGIGVATAVDRHGNVVQGRPLSASFDLGLQTEVWQQHGWPVLLENDAKLAALAERWCGVGTGVDDLAAMLAGERIATGLIESGRLLHGSNGGAGEVGSLELVDGVGSHDGIAKLARVWGTELLASGAETRIRELVGPGTTRVSARFVFEAAAGGDAAAQQILERIARRMARVISLLATLLNPELVVIGGAVAASAAMLLPTIAAELPRLTGTPPRVAVSPLGAAIVATGAVRLALDYVEQNALGLTPAG